MAPLLSLFISLHVLCATLFVGANARPHRRRPDGDYPRGLLSAYTVSLSNGTTSLPAPSSNLALKAITLGRGTQNYTCAQPTADSVPKANGAVATLFDVLPILPFLPPLEGQVVLEILVSHLLSLPYEALEHSSLPVAGHHYFTADLVPTFDLRSSKVGLLAGEKKADIVAPPQSCAGPGGKGPGAVDWLKLGGKPERDGLSEGYRVWTAGGKAPKDCAGQPSHFEVQYAAQYWFYGEKHYEPSQGY